MQNTLQMICKKPLKIALSPWLAVLLLGPALLLGALGCAGGGEPLATEPPGLEGTAGEPYMEDRALPPTPAPEVNPVPGDEERPGFLRRALGVLPFVSSGEDRPATTPANTAPGEVAKPRDKDLRGLELSMDVEPENVDLSEDKRLKINLVLRNTGKDTRALKFSSTQHVEIIIRDQFGNVITRWSEDYVFAQMLTSLAVNPGEKVEWKETLSTRDLEAGRSYTVDAGMVGYSGLQVSEPLNPMP